MMATDFRVGSFNLENLFERPKILNKEKHEDTADLLSSVGRLQSLLEKDSYTAHVQQQILKLVDQLKDYIEITEDRGKLFKGRGANRTVTASGKNDWDGQIAFKTERFSETARENTAKVVKTIKADVLCTVEVDSRPALENFNGSLLGRRYQQSMLIDGNDPRGIDVGLYSKFPIRNVRTHIFDRDSAGKRIFSRDCLEVELELPNGKPLYVLCNHFKSQGYGVAADNDSKRKKQARAVAEILAEYNLASDYVIVAGDFNDSPGRPPHTLKPLLEMPNLFNSLELQYPADPAKHWTYHYRGQFNQIDFLLISKALKQNFVASGVERRGIYKLAELTQGSPHGVDVETEFDSVTAWSNAASDHAAIWADFSI